MATTKKCYIWKNLNKTWNSVNWKWSECELVEELIGSGALDPNQQVPEWLDTNKDKKKRFIKLLCKVKGYNEKETTKAVHDNIKVTIDDVKLVVKAVKNIDFDIVVKK